MQLLKQIGLIGVALAIATAVGVVLVTVGLSIYLSIGDVPIRFNPRDVAYLIVVFCIFAVPVAVALGTPAFFFLRELGWLNPWSVCSLGGIIGTVIGLNGAAGVPWPVCLSLGFLSALVAWLFIKRFNLHITKPVSSSTSSVT
ncbi:MAG: hypothetical protein E6H66_21690 [Betaproteobacteria bacterium]|nr:MAG: hypothetical protein E6H66_21690 [Betaproteobacteria bacterium]